MKNNLLEKFSFLNQTVLNALKDNTERAIIKRFAHAAVSTLSATYAYVYMAERGGFRLYYKTPNTPYEPKRPRSHGIVATVFRSKSPKFIKDITGTKTIRADAKGKMKGVAVIPIAYKKNTYGTLVLCYKAAHNFTTEEKELTAYIGYSAAQSLTIKRLYANLTEIKHTLDYTRDVVFMLEPKDLRILYANQSAAKYFGIPEKNCLACRLKNCQ